MFTLLNPSALLALLGLSVPVAIHLWNRRPGREVAVGSLRWLAAGANRRLRNLKPEQLLLLLLRAAMLAVLAGALAEPVWRQALPTNRGQVLLSPELLGTPALATLRPTIDSLRRRGYALRWLAAGFPKVSAAVWRSGSLGRHDQVRGLAATDQSADNFRWERVQQAASTFPSQPLYVLTPAGLRGLQGRHAPLAARITWLTLPTGSTATWVQAAAFRGDSLGLLVGRSTELRTTFRLASVARPRLGGVVQVAGLPALRMETKAGGSRLQPLIPGSNATNKPVFPVPIRTRPLRVVLYATAEYAPDARYLQAGLRAAAAGLPVSLALSITTTAPSPTTPPDWLFWLTDAPLPGAWRNAVRGGVQVWQEATGPGIAAPAYLATSAATNAPVALFRRGATSPAQPTSTAGFPLWSDGQGRPVLSRQVLGRGAFYQLHTRLNPSWSELADSPTLPAQLLALLQPEATDEAAAPTETILALAAHDQRTLDQNQLLINHMPVVAGISTAPSEQATAAAPTAYRITDLRPALVLLAGLLFAFERLLARRRAALALPLLP